MKLLATIGGILKGVHFFGYFIIIVFCDNLINAKTVNVFYSCTIGHSHEQLHKLQLLAFTFQFKYFIYKNICCSSRYFTKLLRKPEEFLHSIELLNKDLSLVNESLSLKA